MLRKKAIDMRASKGARAHDCTSVMIAKTPTMTVAKPAETLNEAKPAPGCPAILLENPTASEGTLALFTQWQYEKESTRKLRQPSVLSPRSDTLSGGRKVGTYVVSERTVVEAPSTLLLLSPLGSAVVEVLSIVVVVAALGSTDEEEVDEEVEVSLSEDELGASSLVSIDVTLAGLPIQVSSGPD